MSTSLEGTVAIVTGANTGIGRVTALELARKGAHVFVGSRSVPKGREATDDIRAKAGSDTVELLELDLASFASVRRAAAAFLARDLPLQLLVNNAGVAGQGGRPPRGSSSTSARTTSGTSCSPTCCSSGSSAPRPRASSTSRARCTSKRRGSTTT